MTQRGTLVCFTGIDGSGKTTQARLLVDWLTARGVKSSYVWSRGEVLAIRRIFLFMGRRALGTSARRISSDETSYHQYQSRKSKLMGNPLIRTLWSITTYVEHLVQINTDIRRLVQAGYFVVCDRYQWDTLIDLAVLNNKRPQWLVNGFNHFMWKFIPRPSIAFFIDIPPEEAIRRKDDIPSLDYVRTRAGHYRYLASADSFKVIDGCRSAATIQGEINGLMEQLMKGQEQA